MMNILLVCAAGASTSMLAEKMQQEANARGLEATVSAIPEQAAADRATDADVILVGPQMRFKVPALQKAFPDKPVEGIDMRDYGMMNGAAVLDKALQLAGK